jgi:uncharacterized protein
MAADVAKQIVNFAYRQTPPKDKIEIGFFGGEPLLEFNRICDIVDMIEGHPEFSLKRVEMTLVSNGTVFSDEIADFFRDHHIAYGVSCDGPPIIQDMFRHFADGRGSGHLVEKNLQRAMTELPATMVNAVYHPQTFHMLHRVVEYFSELGLRHIYVSPDFSAPWTADDAALLPELFSRIGAFHALAFARGDPHFISIIDGKMAVILRGGYGKFERCRMGRGEYAFSPSGYIYPCERLIGDGGEGGHCIGHIDTGIDAARLHCHPAARGKALSICGECGVRDYCMNWCGCSNFMSSGSYLQPGAFVCASERAAIQAAFDVIQTLESKRLGPALFAHFAGQFAPGSFRAMRTGKKGGA